ncbi:MAG: LPS export ABC transporter permease LptG [Gammaproteobacteria bacterium]|nr:LPS export ABC transporter permease LptG [Gammaproteobacteria bacterium]
MKLLDRYIGKTVISGILGTLLVLLILISFFALIEEVEDVGRGDYRTLDAFKYVLFLMPRQAYDIFPVAVLLGSLIGLGGLASHSELVAIRSAGVSLGRIIFSVMKAGLLVMFLVVLLGEVVAPKSEQHAETVRAEKLYNQTTLKTRYGFWARDGEYFVNIRQILPGSELRDIYIYEFASDRTLKLATHAASARYEDGRWRLQGIKQSRFSEQQVISSDIVTTTWESMINPDLLDVVTRPAMLPAWGLYQYIDFLHSNGQEARVYEVAFWEKIVTPLITLVMVLLSVPFVFGVLRSVGIGQRIFIGAALGVLFLLLNKAFGHMAIVYNIDALFAVSFPGLLFLTIALYFVRRLH